MDDVSDLVKVIVDLPNHWRTSGESMWARPLGDDLYELHNSPFSAYDLNYLDVVVAVSAEPHLKPQICRIERRSGHRTLRLIFKATTERPERDKILSKINDLGATYENADSTLYSLIFRNLRITNRCAINSGVGSKPAPWNTRPARLACRVASMPRRSTPNTDLSKREPAAKPPVAKVRRGSDTGH